MPTLIIGWHSNSVLSGLILGKTRLLRVSLTIYKRVWQYLEEPQLSRCSHTEQLCDLVVLFLDQRSHHCAFFPPLGLMDSDICHMASSHRNSSKLLKKALIRSCFLNEYVLQEKEQLTVRPVQCARETVNCKRRFIGIINSLSTHYNHPALTYATTYNSCHHQWPPMVPWLTRVWKYYSPLHKDLVTTNSWAEWMLFSNVIPNSKSEQ